MDFRENKRCVEEIEEYLGKIDYEEGKTTDPSHQLVTGHNVGYEKKIDNVVVHYAGLAKPYRDWEFRQNEILDGYFETIVSDPVGGGDPELKDFLEKVREFDIILPQNFQRREDLVEQMKKLTIVLSNEVYDFFGSYEGLEEFKEMDNNCTIKINNLKSTRGTNLVYLGELKGCGLCRHRAILFKVVCDMLRIPCRILRGDYGGNPHVWNEVRLVDDMSHSIHLVDTMNFRDGFVREECLPNFKSHDEKTKVSNANSITTERVKEGYPRNRSIDSIGSGNYGIVYEIKGDYINPNNLEIEKMDLVVKVFNITEKSIDLPNIERYIDKEINNLQLLRHSNIIEIIGSFESESEQNHKLINILMKKYPYVGNNFLDKLQLHEEEKKVCVFQFFMEICKGLGFIHSNDKIHFDIKPGNILVRLSDDFKRVVEVRIADFGSVKEENFNLDLTTAPHTTLHYRSPEVTHLLNLRENRENSQEYNDAKKIAYTAMSDIYSFGVVMEEFENYYRGFPKIEDMVKRCLLREEPQERPRIQEIRFHLRNTLERIRQSLYDRELSFHVFNPFISFLPTRYSLLVENQGNSLREDELTKECNILKKEKSTLEDLRKKLEEDINVFRKKNKKLNKIKKKSEKNQQRLLECELKNQEIKFMERMEEWGKEVEQHFEDLVTRLEEASEENCPMIEYRKKRKRSKKTRKVDPLRSSQMEWMKEEVLKKKNTLEKFVEEIGKRYRKARVKKKKKKKKELKKWRKTWEKFLNLFFIRFLFASESP